MSKAPKGGGVVTRSATRATPPPVAWPLPWLMDPWARLRAAWGDDRLGHALLITGPAGIGKRLLAERLGHALLCTAPGADGGPCGQCADCRLLASGNHPDLVLLTPDAGGKSKEIKAEQVRTLCEQQALTPHRAPRKVLQIIPAEGMNLVAANGLLKTLEEPADSTLWVLVSEAPGCLPQTIRSRCQRLDLPLPPTGPALAWLAAQPAAALPGIDAGLLLRLAHGAPLTALALAGTEAGRERLTARAAGLRGFVAVGRGEQDPLELSRAWQAEEPSVVLDRLGSWVCDLLRLRADPGVGRLDNPDQRESLAPLAASLAPAAAHRYLQRVLRARSLSDATINKQMLYEALLVSWARLAKGDDRG